MRVTGRIVAITTRLKTAGFLLSNIEGRQDMAQAKLRCDGCQEEPFWSLPRVGDECVCGGRLTDVTRSNDYVYCVMEEGEAGPYRHGYKGHSFVEAAADLLIKRKTYRNYGREFNLYRLVETPWEKMDV